MMHGARITRINSLEDGCIGPAIVEKEQKQHRGRVAHAHSHPKHSGDQFDQLLAGEKRGGKLNTIDHGGEKKESRTESQGVDAAKRKRAAPAKLPRCSPYEGRRATERNKRPRERQGKARHHRSQGISAAGISTSTKGEETCTFFFMKEITSSLPALRNFRSVQPTPQFFLLYFFVISFFVGGVQYKRILLLFCFFLF